MVFFWNILEDYKHFEKGQFFESFFEIQQETQLTDIFF